MAIDGRCGPVGVTSLWDVETSRAMGRIPQRSGGKPLSFGLEVTRRCIVSGQFEKGTAGETRRRKATDPLLRRMAGLPKTRRVDRLGSVSSGCSQKKGRR